jgi:phosphosulfolactate phosphohydrolase-like enzyme
LSQTIRDSVSGKELDARGFGSDVAAAVQLDVSPNVPILIEGAFALVD